MGRAPRTLLVQAAEAVARAEKDRARQVALLEWRRAQGWDTKRAEAVLARMEQTVTEKRAHLAMLQHKAGISR